MSQIPRPGQATSMGGKIVKTTATKTSGIPGSGRNVTVTKTTITELVPCSDSGPRGQRQGSLRQPGPSGLRPPASGGAQRPCGPTRTQSATQTPAIKPKQTCTAATSIVCPGAGQGAGRSQAPSGGRPPCPGARPSGLQPPKATGGGSTGPSPKPSSTGICKAAGSGGQPAAKGIPKPCGGGIPRTASSQSIGKGGPSRLQAPRPSGLQAPRASGSKQPCAGQALPSSAVTVEPQVQQQLRQRSLQKPGQRVVAKSMAVKMPVVPEVIDTPEGPQTVLQQTVLEQRVERDERGERVIKNLAITDMDPCTGAPKTLTMGIQQLDPKFAKDEGREIIGTTSKVSITADYATITQTTQRAVTQPLSDAADLTAAEIAKMVEEEKEDVENTLRIFPPDLTYQPGRHELKQRLQQLRLNSESVALLEQSIIHPEPTADESQAEPSPEAMAAMMHTVEKGVPPQSTPDQVFNSLFSETSNEKYIKMSSVTQGPLQDVVVPSEIPKEIHQSVVTGEMEKLTERMQGITDSEAIPYVDIFTLAMDDAKKAPAKGKNKEIEFPIIADEKSLWVNADLQHLVNVVGAEPVEVLDPLNLDELEGDEALQGELAKGVQYYVDADPIQYMSRVQLRGTQPPSYFPGYIVALPEFAEIVKLARTPDEVFASAWKAAQPKYFEDDSMQSLLF